MFQTPMDTNPLPPSVEQSALLPTADSAPLTSPSPSMLAEVRRESPFREVFVGPDGMYPATRWLIYLAMGGIVLLIEGAIMHFIHPHAGGPVWWSMVTETSMLLAAILPGVVMTRIEGRPFGDFGLPARGAFGRNFWIGTLWGIASLTVLMLVLRAAGAFTFGSLDLHGGRIVKFALYYAVFFLLTGFFEEFLLRGYSQWVLTKGMNFWPAAALLSISFGALHGFNPGEAKIGLVAVVAIGFFFCLTLRRTGNLWWAVGFHMAWDWGESYLYSVPDSGALLPGHLLNSSLHGPAWLTGGSVGPEGSYLVFAVIAALWIAFDRAYPEVKYGASRGTRRLSSS
ncbi:MAG: CPBP family intramembrane glutamic endopeptidase [Terriglobales bacterium]